MTSTTTSGELEPGGPGKIFRAALQGRHYRGGGGGGIGLDGCSLTKTFQHSFFDYMGTLGSYLLISLKYDVYIYV